MSSRMDAQQTREFLKRYAEKIQAHAQQLSDLDAAIGDADHGSNMERGMTAVVTALPATGTPSDILKSAAMTLISKVGGASGPLYGTALLRAATSQTGKEVWSQADLEAALQAAYQGLLERGKAQVGDKTMLDAWQPALEALPQGLQAASQAARSGAEQTREMVAKKGRASYLGERSKGHIDPGSVSSALFFEALSEVLAP